MLNFISARWQTLKTKYKKFIPFIFTFIFCLSPLSVSAAEVSPDAKNNWFLLPFNQFYIDYPNGPYSQKYISSFDNVNGTFYNTSVRFNGSRFRFLVGDVGAVMPEFHSNREYLLYYTLSFVSPSATTFSAIAFDGSISGAGNINLTSVSQTSGYFDSTNTLSGFFRFSGDAFFSTESQIYLRVNSQFDIGPRVSYAFYVLDITDNTDSEINQIVAAINNQTDKIVNGNDSTGGIVSQFQSNLNQFNSVINQFDDIENGFITDFTTSNEEIKDTLSDYTFTGNLLTCANWVTDRYMDFFDNSGDFKQYFIYPLIMGIALFFIGRGQSILGNLYRKPTESTTVTYSDSSGYKLNKDGSWTRSGSKGSTTTTTYRNGGKLRK